MRIITMLCALMILAVSGPVRAEEQAEAPPPVKVQTDNPHIQAMNDQARMLASRLSREEAQALGSVRENFGILRSIDVARASVRDAVAMCAENNPDMAGDMNGKFEIWNETLDEALTTQEDNMERVVTSDVFTDTDAVKDYLDTVDKAARYADDQLEKQIITTLEACQNLMNSMDGTAETITGMLGDMVWPDPVPVSDDDAAGNDTP